MRCSPDDFAAAFNACASPKDALALVQGRGLSVDDVGHLLYEARDIVSVDRLGECLGHHADFWKHLAESYPNNFSEFAGTDIVSAIRTYLWRFRLPGEALQIDRIMTGFARSYFALNRPATSKGRHVDPGVSGWFVKQPRSGRHNELCCISCGKLSGDSVQLYPCMGCNVVHFCRPCRRQASQKGHAVAGTIGYGRACVAAKAAVGLLGEDQHITFGWFNGGQSTEKLKERSLDWKRESPVLTEDSVMVLSFSIIMLTTNLHSSNVKNKMQKHEFIQQNRGINDGTNFPGDFLAQIYDNIKQDELKVMRPA